MPEAEESAKLIYFFPLDVAFDGIYAIIASFILELKKVAQFFSNYRTAAIYYDRESEPLLKKKKKPKTQFLKQET